MHSTFPPIFESGTKATLPTRAWCISMTTPLPLPLYAPARMLEVPRNHTSRAMMVVPPWSPYLQLTQGQCPKLEKFFRSPQPASPPDRSAARWMWVSRP